MKKLYQIIDGGESFIYSSESKEMAMECHIDMNYKLANVPLEESDIDDEVIEISDSKLLEFGGYGEGSNEYVKMTAKEWSEKCNGLVASTIF